MSNTQPEIEFGPGDTAPIIEGQLLAPDNADGTPGAPVDLGGATGLLEIQVQDHTAAATTRAITMGSDGNFSVDMLLTGGPLASGDYWCRFIFSLTGGYQTTLPGRGTGHPDSPDQSFYWLHVSPDFITVV